MQCLLAPKCIPSRITNLGSWFRLIRSYIFEEEPTKAFLAYTRSRREGLYVLSVLPLLIKASISLSLHHGRALHAESIKAGSVSDLFVATNLVSLYAKFHKVADSRKVFDCMTERNAVAWNALIGAYFKQGDTKSAVFLFDDMSVRTAVTWIEMIGGFSNNGDTVTARILFDRVPPETKNVIIWTVMAEGYAGNGEMEAAREIFEAMPKRNYFVWSSMISGYFKKGIVTEAVAMFEQIPVRNTVNWNSLISGYVQNGLCEAALEAFSRMQAEGFDPDEVTVTSVLSACAQLGRLNAGKEIHEIINLKRIKSNNFVCTALVDMYAKCGDLEHAKFIFEKMPQRNITCWNSMILGLGIHGRSLEAIEFFEIMERSDMKPDSLTFLSALTACSHGGLVQEGLAIYSKMEKCGLAAGVKHYGCLVDLLGRDGRLNEAFELIKTMPVRPNNAVWGALLAACRIHMDTEMAKLVMECVGTSYTNVDMNCKNRVLSNSPV